MEKKNNSKKVNNLIDKLTPQDLEKIREHQSSTDGLMQVDQEWMILAEWLEIAGYQAYLDAKNDALDSDGNLIITISEILTLIEATRKLDYIKQFRQAQASFIGSISAKSKKPLSAFKSLTKNIIKKTKVQ